MEACQPCQSDRDLDIASNMHIFRLFKARTVYYVIFFFSTFFLRSTREFDLWDFVSTQAQVNNDTATHVTFDSQFLNAFDRQLYRKKTVRDILTEIFTI